MSAALTLEELAERCEQASGPSHELDLAIATACYEGRFGGINYDPALWVERYGGHSGSLDAALSLVPENSWLRMDEWPRGFCAPAVSVQPIREPPVGVSTGTGSTLALALCAAALRARANA